MQEDNSDPEREDQKAVLRVIDSMKGEIIDLCAQLVKLQSVNPKYPDADGARYLGGEKDCNKLLESVLAGFGCKTDLFEKAPLRTNLVGTLKGIGGGRSLILNGHIDTVPFGKLERWNGGGPLSGRIVDGRLFGRGSCDMKSGIASMCKAAEAIARAGYSLNGDLFVESVVGEETMDHELGTSATVERGYRADAAIITEPTSLSLEPVTTGVLLLRVSVEGKSTHTTARDMMIRAGGLGDEIGVNAIEKGVKVIRMLQQLEEQWGITKRHPLFNPGHFVIHPGVIDGAPRGHRYVAVVPDYCDIDYAILFPPSEPPEKIKKEIEDYVLTACRLDTWLEKHPPKFDWQGTWPAGEVSPDHPICLSIASAHAIAQGSKVVLKGMPAPVDAPFLDNKGVPAVLYGPGNIEQAHAENEYVSIDQLIVATKTVALSIMEWCGVSKK
ncbi:MAG TPA: ArgE/DapE family deacylase [Nitrososphaerales archaeon]|nr:ArgE/DapE family deacylase [Nitrososphaerales archaeon]